MPVPKKVRKPDLSLNLGNSYALSASPRIDQKYTVNGSYSTQSNSSACEDLQNGKAQHADVRLPFSMLRLVLDELSDRLAGTEVQYMLETEQTKLKEFASELLQLGCKGAIAKGNATDMCSTLREGASANIPHDAETVVDHEAKDEAAQKDTENLNTNLEDWQEDLVGIFKELDADGGGSLSVDELRAALIEARVPAARVQRLIKIADEDNSGEIEFAEWVHAIAAPSPARASIANEMRTISGNLRKKRLEDLHAEKTVRCSCILHPISRYRITFDALVFVVCCYLGIVSPFAIAWENDVSRSAIITFQVMDVYIFVLFTLDIILNFRTGYFDCDHEVVLIPRENAIKY